MTDTTAREAFTVPKPADRREWLDARRPFFNASDSGCLFDCHPHRTLADVAVDKLRAEPAPDDVAPAMERGQRLEPVLLEKWADDHGVRVTTPDVLYVNGVVMATLDGEVVGSDTDAVEAKTTADEWDGLPPHVRWQCVAQAVAKPTLQRVHVVWLDRRMAFRYDTVEPTGDERGRLVEAAEAFMAWIAMGLVPEGTDLGYEHVKALYPTATGEVREVDGDGLDLLRAWAEIRQVRLDAAKAEEDLRDDVARLFGDASLLRHEGVDLATFKNPRGQLRFAERQFRIDHAELYASYVRETPAARRLLPRAGLLAQLGGKR